MPSQLSQLHLDRPEQGQGDSSFSAMESQALIKPGTRGRPIRLETNHITLNVGKLKTAVHYDVNLVPDVPKKLLRNVLEVFRQKHYNNRYPAFDGRKNLYSSSPLPFGDFIADEIAIQDSEGREKKFKVEIKFANNVDLTPLQNLLASRETPREALQVVDIVLRSAPASTCISVGRSFFVKPPRIIDLGEGMEMYNGFFQSAIRGWKPFLNVDVAHKSFPKNINLLDIIVELFDINQYQRFERADLSRPLNRYQLETLNSFVKTLRVSYEIPNHPNTRRVYRVNALDDPPKDKIFRLDTGEQITIEKYFERQKNYKLRYPHLPTLWVGAQQRENKILLPLELCTLEEGQVLNRKMTENQTSRMIKQAATSTDVRKDKIMTALNQARHNNHPSVKEFGFSIGNSFEKLDARVLTPPTLAYSNGTVKPTKGVWRGNIFSTGVTINKWTIACVDRRPPRPDDLSRFAEAIMNSARGCGMTITQQPEKPFSHVGDRQNDINKYFQTQKDKKFDVIFVIVPNSGPQYSYVKTAAEINVGCLTQCVKGKTLFKMNPQTAGNILLKVNSKLNGTNHFLNTRPPIMNKPCMIMGADVTHPSPEAKNIPSVAAVTASHDPKAFKYNICWRLQPPKVEIIEDLEAIAIEQLKYFYQETRVKPERIVFFRDGVSEGQFEQVRRAEIRAIRSACKKLQRDGYEPSITFLVVQKRHHTRLFPTNPRDSEDRNNNVPAGTCVDTTITHPFLQDFYLVSHASIQGVAKPTKYCTLWDDNDMSNDDIEELTYYLCHMFSRCTRSVSYPAPTYYAHLAAARAKVYIENERLNLDQLQREFSRFQIQDVIRKGKPMFFV
ncbi:hypothetical protein NQ315_004837 [Exocentrus adspersus]|uniref:Argonaute 2 n=1 Tax=Exocentrus adspersus TaxID=1586481 RepID=A0AAV8W2H7_9CUCU|nr:hypothetical protein NQ315_004837 [Exocentrus adspersus]